MRQLPRALAAAAVLLVTAACSPTSAPGTSGPRPDRDVLTAEQLRGASFRNVHEAVAALRPTWLTARGPDSFNTPSEVIVYLDNARLGGVEALRGIHLSSVQLIRHFDSGQATTRWGIGHPQGAVQVVTALTPP